jgi:ATP-dependent Lon protease
VSESEKLVHLPVLPIKNTVLFPYLLMPLAVARPVSRAAVEAALATEDKTLLVIAQRDESVEEPAQKDLFTIGTRAVIKKMSRSENALEMIVQGVERIVLVRLERFAHG